ncbi:membrane protein of unknown function [Thermococcus nautili]|uniref:hypothetical protein n=1 Tax=Thermococcus nautili TaxID=195522 RepID=UPI0025568407|nr:hypothetical protein [Thermococcus nautili]CAI1493914.1 membrane protein of unknown function [Thermococcus nautili]
MQDIGIIIAIISILILGYGFNRTILTLGENLSMLLSPATALSLIIWISYILSFLHISLEHELWVLIGIGGLVLFLGLKKEGHTNVPELELEPRDYFKILLALLISLVPKLIYYQYPSANSDPFFHSLKIKEIVLSNSLFFKDLTFGRSLVTYPSGYHSIISSIILITKGQLPDIMEVMYWIEILKGILYPVATFFMVYSIVSKKDVAHLAALISAITPLYYNWQNFIILPATLNYYFFMILIGLYSIYINTRDNKVYLMIWFYAFPMVAIHLFQYYVLGVFVLILAIYHLIKKTFRFAINIITPIVVSPVIYLVLTYPIREFYSPTRIALTNMNNKTFLSYSNNIYDFFDTFIKPYFIDNSTYILTFFTLLGLVLIVHYGIQNRDSILISLISATLFIIVITLNKLTLRMFIPFVSYIYTAGRALILITPLIPVFTAIGMTTSLDISLRYIKSKSKILRLLAVHIIFLLVLSIVLAGEYSIFLQHSNSIEHSLIQENSMSAIRWINSNIPPHNVFLNQGSIGSGQYISSLTENMALFNWINQDKFHVGNTTLHPWDYAQIISSRIPSIAYIDTSKQVCNELHHCVVCSSIDVSDFVKEYPLIYFNRGIWIFNLSDEKQENSSSTYIAQAINDYYKLNNDFIYIGSPKFYKYLVYGFRIWAYDIIAQDIKGEYPAALPIIHDHGTILFVPNRSYYIVTIGVYSLKSQVIRIEINNVSVTKVINKGYTTIELNANIVKGRINIIKIIGNKHSFCNPPDKWIFVSFIKFK